MAARRKIAVLVSAFLLVQLSACTGFIGDGVDPGTNGLDTLGCGYDMFGSFADPDDVKERVFDMAALNAAGLVSYRSVDVAEFTTITGESITEYSKEMAVSVGVSVKLRNPPPMGGGHVLMAMP